MLSNITLIDSLLTAIVTLTAFIGGLIAYLRVVDARQQREINWLKGKLTECEEDRRELWQTLQENGLRIPRKHRKGTEK